MSELQPLNGKLAWFPMAGQIIEIIAVHANIVLFIIFYQGKPRINRTYMDYIEVLE